MHSHTCRYLSRNSLFLINQFAYRPCHSTEGTVILVIDWYLEAADTRLNTGIVSVDQSKAFNKVQHQLLIHDLFSMVLSSIALDWFCSYLSDRKRNTTRKITVHELTTCGKTWMLSSAISLQEKSKSSEIPGSSSMLSLI